MPRSSRNQSGGRSGNILNHERSVDDDDAIIGGDGFDTELGDAV